MSENTEELKLQLETPDDEEKEEKEEENENEENEEEEELEKEFEEEDEEEGEKFQMPDKFKGKSAEEIAKSYVELEKMIERKAQRKAEEIARKKGEEGEGSKKEMEETYFKEEEFPMKDGKIDYASMTPEQFAMWVDRRIEMKAEAKAKEIVSDSQRIRSAIQAEIAEVRKDHPNLKVDKEYTDLVLAIVEAGASKGKSISLKEACEKVDAFIGKQKEIGDEEKKKMKKAKAEVETGEKGGAGEREKSEEEIIKEQLLYGTQTGELGGLGI